MLNVIGGSPAAPGPYLNDADFGSVIRVESTSVTLVLNYLEVSTAFSTDRRVPHWSVSAW